MTTELLDAQGQISETKNRFEEATVKPVIKKANPQSAEGPSGLCYSHLQAALYDELGRGSPSVRDACLFQPWFATSTLDMAHER